MLLWFDWYLKGEGDKPLLTVEMQDNLGGWRVEETWPAPDTEYRQFLVILILMMSVEDSR